MDGQLTIQTAARTSEDLRTVHFVDIENLMCGTVFTADEVANLEARYRLVADAVEDDLVVLASSHVAAPPTWFGWSPSARRLIRSGSNGADLALLDAIENEGLASRFDRLVVGSGDGIFAESCARLQAAHCAVTVVSRRRGTLSRKLDFAVPDVRFLEPVSAPATAALRQAA